MSTAVAFPYGQLGAAMPIAVALALFANINMSFGRAGPAASDGKGAYLLLKLVVRASHVLISTHVIQHLDS